jgi:BirA family biotin operon repressor/biotin-[acetyl-CoA-carboxylase] ligase
MQSTEQVAPATATIAGLTTRWLGRCYEHHAVCGSTNDVAAGLARAEAPAGLVVAADGQTAGRGRLGRTWHSPAGEHLYFSVLLRPARRAAEIPPVTLLAGAVIAKVVAALGVTPRLKWPNDVQVVDSDGRPRKLAGILTEMTSAGEAVEHAVIGVGLNVNGVDFPGELAERATSLRRELGRPVDRAALLASLLNALEPALDDYERQGPVAAVQAFGAHAAFPAPCRVTTAGAPLAGTALGVEADGALLVRDDSGRVHRVLSGELLP